MKMYSNEYITQLKELHARRDRPRGFGGKIKPLGLFHSYVEQWQPKTALDYGCGKGTILEHNKLQYPNIDWEGYDPAVIEYSTVKKQTYDLVFSNDVLEHIEPEYVTNVLEHINTLADKFIWLRIDTKPARKVLQDGRNAHISLNSSDWWKREIEIIIPARIDHMTHNRGKLDIALTKEYK